MKKGRFISVVVLALCLVVGIGILYSTLYAGCYCHGGCQYCDWETGSCTTFGGPGACFCTENPCRLSEHMLCCVAH
jgi:hypothetical protein